MREDLPVSAEKKPTEHDPADTAGVQAPQYRYGQDRDINVYKNTRYRSPKKSRKRVKTVSRNQRKPVFLHWSASKNIEKNADEKPGGAEACGDEDICPEDDRVPSDPEYSHIEEKRRIFRH